MTDLNEIEILLVEDNPTDAEFVLQALRKNHLAHRILVVTDGEEALDFIFARRRYQDRKIKPGLRVVLLDLHLPKVDGLDVLRILKIDPRTRAIPVVVLTSSNQDRDIADSYRLGANSYIVKPVEYEKFLETMRHLGFYWLLLNQPPKTSSTLTK